MEYLRPGREARHTLIISDPQPAQNVGGVWASLGRVATIGIFLFLFAAFLYFGRAILLPVFCAGVVALTLAPSGQGGQPPRHFAVDHGDPDRRVRHRSA